MSDDCLKEFLILKVFIMGKYYCFFVFGKLFGMGNSFKLKCDVKYF